ncbi:MAG: hypothetical protein JST80_08380 [Bdellovibrionales bacterium]|nr:hypothetical protein [Bdellovibrionales bacterium]
MFIRNLILISVLSLSACVTTDHYNKPSTPTPTSTPKKPPPSPEPPKEYEYECKILNNEGRIYKARNTDSSIAEHQAKRECGRMYRHCTLLSCDLVEIQPQ